jgi:hypothetical protein
MPKTRIAIVALTLFLAVGASAQAEIKRGDAGPNTFSGTPHRDWYWGYGGNDTLFGRAATDYLYGGGDNDTIVAGRGADFAYGGDGADEIALRRGTTSRGAARERIESAPASAPTPSRVVQGMTPFTPRPTTALWTQSTAVQVPIMLSSARVTRP